MRLAYQLGAAVVVNQLGAVPRRTGGPQWDLLLDTLTDLGNYGHHVGAVLAAETGSRIGSRFETIARCASRPACWLSI